MEYIKSQIVHSYDPSDILTIKTEVYVTKLHVDTKTKHAIAVEYASTTKNNEIQLNSSFAKKEMILLFGAINLPNIFIFTGIEPKEKN
ncbi:hypothetical protein E2986_12067 [Frieseomelitta varia]|uniref:Uncharacterized protein n=1 Tax=Frieseomelitta varia TaxID=561572 RepID=A0A833SBT9_9HYME|nr:hypothetical protein E2986_12067 [Frieseomelitta varia]